MSAEDHITTDGYGDLISMDEVGAMTAEAKVREYRFADDAFGPDIRKHRDLADAAITELLDALELRDKMLRLAWEDAYPMHGDTYDSGGIYKRWLADLRERAERRT